MPQKSLKIDWDCLAVIMLPMLVFIVGDLAIYLFSNPDLKWNFTPSDTIAQTESAKRHLLIGALFLVAAVSVFVFFAFCSGLVAHMDWDERKKIILASLILISPLLFVTIMNLTQWDDGAHFHFFTNSRYDNDDSYRTVLSPNRLNMDTQSFSTLMRLTFDFFLMLGVIGIIMGCIATLCRSDGREAIDEFQLLSRQARDLNRHLYYGVVFMISVLAFVSFWIQWQPSLIGETFIRGADGKPLPSAYDNIEKSISMFFGLQFTLIIVSYYIPTAVILNERICRFARRQLDAQAEPPPLTEKAIQDFKTKHGLTTFETAPYKVFAAILSPLLAGVLGNTVSTALSAFGK